MLTPEERLRIQLAAELLVYRIKRRGARTKAAVEAYDKRLEELKQQTGAASWAVK